MIRDVLGCPHCYGLGYTLTEKNKYTQICCNTCGGEGTLGLKQLMAYYTNEITLYWIVGLVSMSILLGLLLLITFQFPDSFLFQATIFVLKGMTSIQSLISIVMVLVFNIISDNYIKNESNKIKVLRELSR